MFYVLQRVVSELVVPPFAPFGLLMLAWLMARRYPKPSLVLGWLAAGWFLVSGLSVISIRLAAPTPAQNQVLRPADVTADAIVVLGGGRYLNAREYAGDTAGPSTLERLRYAARLYRETGKPVLVTGGKPGGLGTLSEGAIMRRILQDEFHVPVRWVESESQETRENALLSAPLLKAAGVKRIYLVTHAPHMSRAVAEFESAGFETVAMATGFIEPEVETVFSWTPSFAGMANNRALLYEFLARVKPF
jgi:uncharacterized SAM-binding protein YcdF (DUF218 family)